MVSFFLNFLTLSKKVNLITKKDYNNQNHQFSHILFQCQSLRLGVNLISFGHSQAVQTQKLILNNIEQTIIIMKTKSILTINKQKAVEQTKQN